MSYAKLPVIVKECKNCNTKFTTNLERKEMCSKKCWTEDKKKHHLENQIKKSHEKFKDSVLGVDYVSCHYCSYKAPSLNHEHLKLHGTTTKKYREDGHQLISDNMFNLMSNRVTGDKNPAANHGGKFSPFSSKFVGYKSDEEYQENLKRLNDQRSEVLKTSGNCSATLLYWTKLGYSDEEAREKLSERQKTFSLEQCINKHGEEEGRKIWRARQDKWQETLNSKSDEEKLKINASKATFLNYETIKRWIKGSYDSNRNLETIPSELYVCKFMSNDSIKVGFTSISYEERARGFYILGLEPRLEFRLKSDAIRCFLIEQIIHRYLYKFKIKVTNQTRFPGYTETYTNHVLPDKIGQVANMLNTYSIDDLKKLLRELSSKKRKHRQSLY